MKCKSVTILSLFLATFILFSCNSKNEKGAENDKNIMIYAPAMHEWYLKTQLAYLEAQLATFEEGTENYFVAKAKVDEVKGNLDYLSKNYLGSSMPELFADIKPTPLPPVGPNPPTGPFPIPDPTPCTCTIPLNRSEIVVPATIKDFKLQLISAESGEVIGGFSKEKEPVNIHSEEGLKFESYELEIWGDPTNNTIIQVSLLSGFNAKTETYRIMTQLPLK